MAISNGSETNLFFKLLFSVPLWMALNCSREGLTLRCCMVKGLASRPGHLRLYSIKA